MSTRPARIIVGALALVAGLGVGCGGSDSSDSADNPEDAVQAFYDAVQSEDAAAVCATFSADFKAVVEEAAGSCEAEFEATFGSSEVPDGLTVGDASIDGDTATVDVTTAAGETNTATLVNEDGWKIDQLSTVEGGDSPTGGTDSTTG